VFEECLERDGDEVDVVVGHIYETRGEELKAAHVDVVRIDVSVLCRVGSCETISRCVLSSIVIPVDDFAEALCLKIGTCYRSRGSGSRNEGENHHQSECDYGDCSDFSKSNFHFSILLVISHVDGTDIEFVLPSKLPQRNRTARKAVKSVRANSLGNGHEALVVFAATVVPATPIVILAPFIFAAPVLVFTPLLARSNGPVNFGHVKTGFARNRGCLKAFPEASSSLVSRTFSLSTRQLFWLPNTSYECYARQHSDLSDQEQLDRSLGLTPWLNNG